MKEELSLTQNLKDGINVLYNMTDSLKVLNPNDRISAMNIIRDVKDQRKRIEDFFATPKKKAHETWKVICDKEKEYTGVLDRVEKIVKEKIRDYDLNEERRREEERKRLQAIEDERIRKEKEKMLKYAERLKTPEKKEALIERAEQMVAASVQIEEPGKKQGEYYRTIWKARIVDVNAIPREWMIPNQTGLDAFAKATKGVSPIPGVEFYQEKTLTVKGV